MDILHDNSTQETRLIQEAETSKQANDAHTLAKLIQDAKLLAATISVMRGNQLIKQLVEKYTSIQDLDVDEAVKTLEECIDWASQNKRVFLNKFLQVTVASVLHCGGKHQQALQHIANIIHKLKQDNDNLLLLKVYLLESKCYYALTNYDRARSSMVACRATANTIYVPPGLQGCVDLQTGVVHAALHRDYATAASYFTEAFRLFDEENDEKCRTALKYTLLCFLMTEDHRSLEKVIHADDCRQYSGLDVEALQAISACLKNKSIHQFQQTLSKYHKQVQQDDVMKLHLKDLENRIMEYSILKILEPYCRVQVGYVADKLVVPRDQVERKLSSMILDGKISGVLDQESGSIIIFQNITSCQIKIPQICNQVLNLLLRVINKFYVKANQLVN